MPIHHNCAQNSEEWIRLKLGIPSASNFSRIWTAPQKRPNYPFGRESEQWETYAHALLFERIVGRRDEAEEKYHSPWMERGSDLERDAVEWYQLLNDIDTSPIGFITTDNGKIGCSPDRVAGDDGLVEFKSPKGSTHLGYFLKGQPEPLGRDLALRAIDKKYWVQLQGQLYVSERKWVDIVSYHPDLLDYKVCVRLERDEDYIGAMATGLQSFCHYLDTISAKRCPDWMEKKQDALGSLARAVRTKLRAETLGGEIMP